MTFIYGARSWMDATSGHEVQKLLPNNHVEVYVSSVIRNTNISSGYLVFVRYCPLLCLLFYFFQVFFGRPRFLLPLTSRSRATLKTLSSFLHSTCPYHLIPFAVANWFIVSFNPSTSLFFSRLSVNNFLTAHGSHHSSLRSR